MSKRTYLSKRKTVQLIKEVKHRPCIWNPDDEEYGARYPLTRAWADISFTLDLPATFLRTKWKNLRDTYKKERKKYPQGYTGPWRHFKSLSFLVFRADTNENSESDTPENDTEDEADQGLPEIKIEPLWKEHPVASKKKKKANIDFNVLFLKSLTPYFRQLEHLRKLKVRSKMQDMLLNEIAAQGTINRLQI